MKNESIKYRPTIRGAHVAKTYLIKYHPMHDGKIEDAIFTAEIRGTYSKDYALNKIKKMLSAYNLEYELIGIEEITPLTSL